MIRHARAAAALALLLAGCSSDSGSTFHDLASRSTTRQLRQDGRYLIDGQGRVVLLHGVNAVWKRKPYFPPDEPAGFQQADAEFLKQQGFNTVRLGVIFAGVMPEPGVIDSSYLDGVDRVVELLAAEGIWVLLDFHQDLYSERFGGEGFPDWAVHDDGLPHLLDLGFPGNYFTLEVGRTFDNLYANAGGVWADYRAAWKAVARKWQAQPYLMGYDLINEPWPGTLWLACANPIGCPLFDTLELQPFQQYVSDGIREVDPRNVIWWEPNVLLNSGAQTNLGLLEPISAGNLGLSWHNYCFPAALLHSSGVNDIPGCDLLHRIVFENAAQGAARMQATSLVTEFGASDDLADIEQVTDQADEFFVGWQYWHYKEWGDPTTESQTSGGQGLFKKDSDLTTLKAAKADVLIRPYPQATNGTPKALSFDRSSGAFSYRYTPGGASGPTVIFVPSRQYLNGYVATVEGGSFVRTALGLEVTAAGAGDVTVKLVRP